PGGGPQGLGADRLYHRLAQRFAHRRFDSALVHGRHRGPALPRVRRDAERDDPGFGRRLADPDADDVREDPATYHGLGPWPAVPGLGSRFRRRDLAVREVPDLGPATPGDDDGCRPGDPGRNRATVLRRAQGVLPRAGYGRDHGHLRRAAGYFVRSDGKTA